MVITAVGEFVQIFVPAGAHEVPAGAGCLVSSGLSSPLIRGLAKPSVEAQCALAPPVHGYAVQALVPDDGPSVDWWEREFRWLLADPRAEVPWRRDRHGVSARRIRCRTDSESEDAFETLANDGFRHGVETAVVASQPAAAGLAADSSDALFDALGAVEGELRQSQRMLAATLQAMLGAFARTLAELEPMVAAPVATRISHLLTRLDRRLHCLRPDCGRPATLTVMTPGKTPGLYFVHVSVRGDRPGPHRWDPRAHGYDFEVVEHLPD